MSRDREWRFYIDDMIRFAEKVIVYTRGFDQPGFERHDLVYDATLRNIELIGEAASHIPAQVRDRYPSIPWRMIVATRNGLIHGYPGFDSRPRRASACNRFTVTLAKRAKPSALLKGSGDGRA